MSSVFDAYDKMLETALSHVGMWSTRCEVLAYMLYRATSGDDVEDVYEKLHEYGFTDQDGEWIYDEDDEQFSDGEVDDA